MLSFHVLAGSDGKTVMSFLYGVSVSHMLHILGMTYSCVIQSTVCPP